MTEASGKYIVKVDKDATRLKRIFDDLAVHRECVIKSNSDEWHGPMRKLGVLFKKNELVEKNIVDPIWEYKKYNVVEQRLIRLKPDVKIERIIGNGKTSFKFKRRRII